MTKHASEQHHATSLTPHGKQLLYQAISPTAGVDLYVISTEGEATSQQTRANESQGRVSPDGRWVSYVSDESSQPQVYFSRYPEMQGKVTISTNGGTRPFRRNDGKELFYPAGDGRLMTVSLTSSGTELSAASSSGLFRPSPYGGVYAPSSDGKRFLIARPVATGDIVPLEIVAQSFALTRQVKGAMHPREAKDR